MGECFDASVVQFISLKPPVLAFPFSFRTFFFFKVWSLSLIGVTCSRIGYIAKAKFCAESRVCLHVRAWAGVREKCGGRKAAGNRHILARAHTVHVGQHVDYLNLI